MSGIAGIIHFDGAPLEPGSVEKMTAAMARRGPDGVRHWVKGSVGLGQCMLHTTPESLEETQPLTNEDESVVLVMDGRVDNGEELRRELLRRGSALRDRSDAELVLRAYEAWGEDCPVQIIGEFAFFIRDARRQQLFGARDTAGRRHLYYHEGAGWFAFASEIKGLTALGRFDPMLNEPRLLDYLAPQFDRDDEVGTFYQNINRLPAGHSMQATAQEVKTWRYWDPGNLPEMSFASLDDCAEAFLEQLRVAVKCRLRSVGPIGATLSGGLDSSSIVGLISKEFRSDLNHPLLTFSLIRHDRENCPDWFSIQEILKHDDWIEPSVITSNISTDAYLDFLDCIPNADEPFAIADRFPSFMIFSAARANGCKVIFDGAAGDLLFYGYDRSADAIMKRKLYDWLPAFIAASSRHRFGIVRGTKTLARRWLADVAPVSARAAHRRLRAKHATPEHEFPLLRPEIARELWATKHARRPEALDHSNRSNDQFEHARIFTSGAISFAYEGDGELANGIELRSPFSDRRMVEFALRMPVEAKLFANWYKHVLRKSMHGVLPEAVRWRQDIHGHPGWKFYERVFEQTLDKASPISQGPNGLSSLDKWLDPRTVCKLQRSRSYQDRLVLYRVLLLSQWMKQGKLGF